MNPLVRAYLAEIGRRGGQKSRRQLDKRTASNMVRLREAQRAFKKFYARCFWSYDPNYHIGYDDITWVAKTLMKHGGHQAWKVAERLCR